MKSMPMKPVDSGRMGAIRRWSNPANRKLVRLDTLTPEQKARVLAFVAKLERDND